MKRLTMIATLFLSAVVLCVACTTSKNSNQPKTTSNTTPIPESKPLTSTEAQGKFKLADDIKVELAEKGWNEISADQKEEKFDVTCYTVTGKMEGKYDNPTTIIVSIIFDSAVPQGQLDKIIYLSESGRDMESDEILKANDPILMNYMYSY